MDNRFAEDVSIEDIPKDCFVQVGIRPASVPQEKAAGRKKGKPFLSMGILFGLFLGCSFCGLFLTKDPTYMDLYHANTAPCRAFWFGTDTMGRDIFSMIWYGGRISLAVGFLAAAISTAAAVFLGGISALAPKWLDALLMRLTEIFLSIPQLLLIILLQAAWGQANVLSLSVAIGLSGWTSMAKVVRTEVCRLRSSEYVLAARCMGAGFFHILQKHLLPNLLPSVLFMVVMQIRSAILSEATLSFLGLGLPLEIISWGSMLSLSEKSMLTGAWWNLLIPGGFLLAALLSVTNIGNYLREGKNPRQSNL